MQGFWLSALLASMADAAPKAAVAGVPADTPVPAPAGGWAPPARYGVQAFHKRLLTGRLVRRRSALVIGASQFGKSTAVLKELIAPAILGGRVSVWVLDPANTLSQAAGELALAKGQGPRLVVLDLKELVWIFSVGFAERPPRDLPWRLYRQQAYETAKELAEVMVSQRGKEYGGLDGKVLVKEWVIAAILLWVFQPTDVPLIDLPWALRPGTARFDALVAACTDPEVQEKFLLLTRLARNVTELYRTVGPAARLIDELFSDEVFRLLADPTSDLETLIRRRVIVVVKGGTNPNTTRVLLRSIWQRIVRVLKRNWARTEEPLPVLVVADEASTYVGEPESQSLMECLKMMTDPATGEGGFVIVTQTPDFGDPLVNVKVSQNCTLKYVFHCGGLVAPLAAAELKAGIDPDRVKRVRTRMEHTGQFSEVPTRSKGKSKDKEGHEREDERVGVSFQPIYRPVEEEELWGLNDQVLLTEVALQRLTVGECWVRDGADIFFRRIEKLKDPWGVPGLGRRKLAAHVEAQRRQGVYRRATDPVPPPATPSPASATPKARSKRPPKGMR